jgi:hypothetical protein
MSPIRVSTISTAIEDTDTDVLPEKYREQAVPFWRFDDTTREEARAIRTFLVTGRRADLPPTWQHKYDEAVAAWQEVA